MNGAGVDFSAAGNGDEYFRYLYSTSTLQSLAEERSKEQKRRVTAAGVAYDVLLRTPLIFHFRFPFSFFRIFFDSITLSLIIFSIFYLPYSVCFNDTGSWFLMVLDNYFCDAIFAFDMLISIFSWTVIEESSRAYDKVRDNTAVSHFGKTDIRTVINEKGILPKYCFESWSGVSHGKFRRKVTETTSLKKTNP